jgi:pimeloyl-ACP methyl ester carboxylesterase
MLSDFSVPSGSPPTGTSGFALFAVGIATIRIRSTSSLIFGLRITNAEKTGWGADRLSDDVLAVLEALRLQRPILVGHSLAGEELSSIGSPRPERIAGLIFFCRIFIRVR